MQTTLLKKITNSLRWSLSVGMKFVKVAPWQTSIVVLTTLVAQIAFMLAFLLPLKVIILLGSQRIPSFFPDFLKIFDLEELVVLMSIATVFFYITHVVASHLISWLSGHGAKRLLEKSSKIILFEDQDKMATQAFSRYSRSIASLVFLSLSLTLLAWLYSTLAIAVLFYWIVLAVFLVSVRYISKRTSEKIIASLSTTLNLLASIGFLFAFAFVVAGFLVKLETDITFAIISLALVRQVMQRMSLFILDQTALSSQRLQINALFFHDQIFISKNSQSNEDIWSLLDCSQRERWILPALKEVTNIEYSRVDSHWHETGVPDVLALEIAAHSGSSSHSNYYIKVFNKKQKVLALHEASLLSESQNINLPVLDFVGAITVEGFHCHIFNFGLRKKVAYPQFRATSLQINIALLAVEPPQALAARYSRSRPYLWQRLNNGIISRLKLVAADQNSLVLEQLDLLAQEFGNIQEILKNLPIQFLCPDANPESILISENAAPLVTHWGRWGLEPLGAGWPLKERHQLSKLIEEATPSRQLLEKVKSSHVSMSALMFAFERFFKRQQYNSALALLPDILDCLSKSGKTNILSSN